MRHRMGGQHTGLGNPSPVLLNNTGEVNPDFAEQAIGLYFKEWNGCDFDVKEDEILLGLEPAYYRETLKIISINRDKLKSYIKTGIAWGYYGSRIVSKIKYYDEYKYKSKFVKFINEWHSKLFKEKE